MGHFEAKMGWSARKVVAPQAKVNRQPNFFFALSYGKIGARGLLFTWKGGVKPSAKGGIRSQAMEISFTPGAGVKIISASAGVTIKEPSVAAREPVLERSVAHKSPVHLERQAHLRGGVSHKLDPHEQAQAQLLKAMLGTIKHYFGGVKALFQPVSDPRQPNMIDYPLAALLFTGLLMFLCHLGARRQIQHKLRDNGPAKSKMKALFGVAQIPHGDTLNYGFKSVAVADMQEVVCGLVERLIRTKVLYRWRLLKHYYLVTIDGTGRLSFKERHCEHCLTRKLRNGQTLYYHPVLEAKLVTANGFAFSLMTEFIENSDPTATKQDCELKAFYRLSERLKKRFPRLPICLLLDGLFAGGPTFARCERYHWKYLIVLTDDDLATVNQEFESLCQISPDNRLHLELGPKKKIVQDYRWMDEIAYVDSQGQHHQLAVLECVETKIKAHQEKTSTTFKWLTNFELTIRTVEILANDGGRLRWKIENEGFNAQKNGGFALEHAYSQDETAAKIFYFLLQIAHLIFQLLEKGSLFRQAFPNGVGASKNIAFRLLEAWRNLRLNTQGFLNLFSGKFQIRFDSS